MYRKLSIIIVSIFFIFCMTNSWAKVVEKIIVIVNDDIITKTELDERLTKTNEQLTQLHQKEKTRSEVLDQMIDEILFIQEALKKNIQVSDADIQREISLIKKEFTSDEAFEKALAVEGYTMESLKKEKKKTLLLQTLVKQKFESGLNVTDDEVRKFHKDNREQFTNKSDSIKLKNILIKFNITDADREKARLRAENVLNQCLNGANFEEMITKFSDDPITKASKGDIGYFFLGIGLYPELEDAASQLAVGGISKLIEMPNSYDIIKVTDIRKDGSVRAQRISIAIWPDPEAERIAEEKANDILKEIKNGADFVDMVKKYSDDAQSKEKDGNWAEVPIDRIGPDLRTAFDSLDTGAISRPVKMPYGIGIFKVSERQDLSDSEMEQIREFLRMERVQEKLSAYSKKLRDSSYIQKIAED